MITGASSSKNRIVYCEGTSGSPDNLLLSRLINPSPAGAFNIQVDPIGSKGGWNKFFDSYSRPMEIDYVAIADRDFEVHPNLDSSGKALLQVRAKRENEREYLTGLPCIESYFLEANLLQRYLVDQRFTSIPSLADLEDALIKAAQLITFYMAVKWGFSDLRGRLPSFNVLRDINHSPDEIICVSAAQQQITDLRDRVAKNVTTWRKSLLLSEFEVIYNDYKNKFTQSSFYLNREFIVWFHGKDLMRHWFNQFKGMFGKSAIFCEWAGNNLDFNQFPDLLEFRQICWYTPLK